MDSVFESIDDDHESYIKDLLQRPKSIVFLPTYGIEDFFCFDACEKVVPTIKFKKNPIRLHSRKPRKRHAERKCILCGVYSLVRVHQQPIYIPKNLDIQKFLKFMEELEKRCKWVYPQKHVTKSNVHHSCRKYIHSLLNVHPTDVCASSRHIPVHILETFLASPLEFFTHSHCRRGLVQLMKLFATKH